jgi:leader peptidase (prepilin peptidase)/N-methyltransferase
MTGAELALLAVLGLAIGSFLNVCISRLPAGESIVSPRSRCPSCGAAIAWFDNIPVVSYWVLAGRCRACGRPIGLRYPVVEAMTALAFVLQGVATAGDLPLLASRLAFTALLIALFGTDLETLRLPNVLTLPGIVLGVLFSLVTSPGVAASLLGAAAGGAVLLVVRWGWRMATGAEGMGLGDVKMLAMIGAFLGHEMVVVVLFLSSVAGAAVGIVLAAAARVSMKERLPFGAFLAVAAYVASIVGEPLMNWYLGSLG